MSKILIVDDDKDIACLVSDVLEDEGFETRICNSGEEVLDLLEEVTEEFSLIMLDIMMPGISGLDLCQKIRSTVSCPIIFVSAKGKTFDTVFGLEIGADDYISKPFVVEELVARVKAHIRRDERANSMGDGMVLKVGEISINRESYEVFKNGELISLSTREFQLLLYLMENAGKVLTREQIFKHVWDTEFGDIGTVAVNIKSVRDKIDPNNQYIKTVWGVGYKFVRS